MLSKLLPVGSRSILFGAHQFILHPLFVALAWWQLYGFPFDPRLWIAFFVHDLGYWGKPNLDGAEGETHPEFGAGIMARFDRDELKSVPFEVMDVNQCIRDGWKIYGLLCGVMFLKRKTTYWHDLALYHSRFYAKKNNAQFSKLCVADKQAIVLTPAWLYLPLVKLTGEVTEYMSKIKERRAAGEGGHIRSYQDGEGITPEEWYARVQDHSRRWVAEHKDCRVDTWTPAPNRVSGCE